MNKHLTIGICIAVAGALFTRSIPCISYMYTIFGGLIMYESFTGRVE